jgi:hypothetical protein
VSSSFECMQLTTLMQSKFSNAHHGSVKRQRRD